MNTQEIHIEISKSIDELVQLLSSFDQEEVNIVPFEGSWTAGQLAQHVIMSCSGFTDTLNGPVKDTNRKPDEMASKIKSDFLNFDTKMKSPDFIVPPEKIYKKEELLHVLEDIKAKISTAAETLDLTKTCISFELPVYGFLTRFEALSFVLYHTQRHVHQLKNIHKHIIGRKVNIS